MATRGVGWIFLDGVLSWGVALLDRGFLDVLRGVVGHFARDSALIFKAIVKNKYKNDSAVGFEAIYGA